MENMKAAFFAVWQTVRQEWVNLDWDALNFGRYNEAVLAVVGLILLTIIALFIGFYRRSQPGRTLIALPGILSSFRGSPLSFVRHLPVLLFFGGLAFFIVAFADPYLAFTEENLTVRGQKIAILVDASGSMGQGEYDFKAEILKLEKGGPQVFYSAVAAAESFVKLRMEGGHRDLVGFILFGNEAYVVTPFTPDYQNILTSISLVGEEKEYNRFPDKGTMIMRAMEQAMQLFRSFGFINSSGNAIVLFSDGEDSQVIWEGKSMTDILASAQEGRIPVYFIRTRAPFYGNQYPDTYAGYDESWRKATEATGGKFYLANDEKVILQTIKEMDSDIKGEISTTYYTAKRPYFLLFLAVAFVIWSVAVVVAFFRFSCKFP